MSNFKSLNIKSKLLEILEEKGYKEPTEIQKKAIPNIIKGNSVIGISNTGSGKTLAFVIPILNDLMKKNHHYHSLICVPTRELAKQIEDVFLNLGESLGLRVLTIIGGEKEKDQKSAVFKAPHVIIGTPGRLTKILERIHLFKKLKFLVLDECDKLLEKNYEDDIVKILSDLNEERKTLLFSATMTDSVEKLAKLSLKNPIRIEINSTFDTVEKLDQRYVFIPHKYKECYLVELLKKDEAKTIVFISNCLGVQTYCEFLKSFDIDAIALYGELSQEKRLKVLDQFKNMKSGVMVATDVASRGLDIPSVEKIINFDLPRKTKEYIHRIGRTARAGEKGTVINMVTQYDIGIFQKIEKNIDKRMELYSIHIEDIQKVNEKVVLNYKKFYEEIKNTTENTKRRKRSDK